jgi:hypothetical protein
MRGVIASAGFSSGDRVVIGCWTETPIGPMVDVMWAEPDGTRVLLVADDRAAAFITAVYEFDRVEVVPFEHRCDSQAVSVLAGELRIELTGGRGRRIPSPRPAWFTRWVEGPIARRAMGVRTYGVSPTGVREWYRADVHRRVVAGSASISGRDLGPLAPIDPPVRFGFSEPPRRPSIVTVRPLLHDPSGRLDRVIG